MNTVLLKAFLLLFTVPTSVCRLQLSQEFHGVDCPPWSSLPVLILQILQAKLQTIGQGNLCKHGCQWCCYSGKKKEIYVQTLILSTTYIAHLQGFIHCHENLDLSGNLKMSLQRHWKLRRKKMVQVLKFWYLLGKKR